MAAALVACGACGALTPPAPAPATPTGAQPEPPRQPDGVVIDQPTALPDVDERAAARGIVALRAPLGSEATLTVVHRLLRGFTRGGIEALEAIVTEDAVILGTVHGRGSLLDQWKVRLKNLNYARLSATEVVDDDKIERFTYEDLDVPGAPERPTMMKRGDLFVRFPVATPRVGSEQLFGDEITLLLRREGSTYKIAGFGEENGP